jgi:hypothetical protein
VSAVRLGEADLAVGDLIRSSLFNLLILGLLDLSRPSRGRLISRAAAAHAQPATVGVALTAVGALAILIGPRGDYWVLGLGLGSCGLLITYMLGARKVFFDQRVSLSRVEASTQQRAPEIRHGLWPTFGRFGLATAVTFSRPPRWLAPPRPVSAGGAAANISQTHAITTLWTILVTAVAILGQLYQVDKRVRIREPDVVLALLLAFGAVGLANYLGCADCSGSPFPGGRGRLDPASPAGADTGCGLPRLGLREFAARHGISRGGTSRHIDASEAIGVRRAVRLSESVGLGVAVRQVLLFLLLEGAAGLFDVIGRIRRAAPHEIHAELGTGRLGPRRGREDHRSKKKQTSHGSSTATKGNQFVREENGRESS